MEKAALWLKVKMHDFYVVLLALGFGWLGSMAKSYFLEKGKNLATKEDIEEITKKIEVIKHAFNTLFLKSSAFVERQIKAFDEITAEINEIQRYCFRESQESEHAVPFEPLSDKSTFQRAVHLREVSDKHRVFISTSIFTEIVKLSHEVFHLGTKEENLKLLGEVPSLKSYEEVRLKAKNVVAQMKGEFFDDQET